MDASFREMLFGEVERNQEVGQTPFGLRGAAVLPNCDACARRADAWMRPFD
jgi:hypothetical protein